MVRNIIQVIFALVVNILFVTLTVWLLPESISFSQVYMFITLLNMVIAFLIFANRRSFEEKMLWIIIILFIPFFGLLMYLLFGLDYNLIRIKRGHKYSEKEIRDAEEETTYPTKFISQFADELDFFELIDTLAHKPIRFNNRTELLDNGDEFFPRLFKEIENAKEYIHLQYFIIKDGDITNELVQLLCKKAKEGVEVRALFDYFGALSFKGVKELNSAGVITRLFNPLSTKIILDGLNYRNHRKITVIDGKIGFTGGINIGDEYNHKDKYYGFWRDSHLLIEGDAVKSLHLVFIKDWYYTTNENLLVPKYLKCYPIDSEGIKSGVQIIDDGPDTYRTILKDIFFKAIMEARKQIRISTPYLIPGSELLKALKVAAMSGVKIQILVPGKPDKKLVYQATKSYFDELLDCGCEIYFYGKNFMHSKILIIDDNIASIGTTNIDFRSFHLHFENTAMLYNDPTIHKMVESFDHDISMSTQINYSEWKKRGYHKRVVETFARLFSPMF